jgi:lysyl-tRNA synthetase class 2
VKAPASSGDEPPYNRGRLTAFEIGDEAILDMRAFSLNGPGMKSVRKSVSR